MLKMSEYKQQIVAFIDILGYKEIVEKAEGDEQKAAEIIKQLQSSINNAVKRNLNSSLSCNEPLDMDPKYRIFSDCICISSDCIAGTSANFRAQFVFHFILNLVYVQAELLLHNIFIRGGVVVGNHHISDEMIFSAALVKSYNLESKEAIYPRILIDNSVINILRNSGHEADYGLLNALIKRDADGLVFLDYLEYVNEVDYPEYQTEEFFSRHKTALGERLVTDLPAKVKEKYLWAARYHNQKVEDYFESSKPELLIDRKYLRFSENIFTPMRYTFNFETEHKRKCGLMLVKAKDLYDADKRIREYLKKKKLKYHFEYANSVMFERDVNKEEILSLAKQDKCGVIFIE